VDLDFGFEEGVDGRGLEAGCERRGESVTSNWNEGKRVKRKEARVADKTREKREERKNDYEALYEQKETERKLQTGERRNGRAHLVVVVVVIVVLVPIGLIHQLHVKPHTALPLSLALQLLLLLLLRNALRRRVEALLHSRKRAFLRRGREDGAMRVGEGIIGVVVGGRWSCSTRRKVSAPS
jgi:hypothetical protein